MADELRTLCGELWVVVAGKRYPRASHVQAFRNAATLGKAQEVETHQRGATPRRTRCHDCATCCG